MKPMTSAERLKAEYDLLTVQYRVLTLDRDGLLERYEKLEAERDNWKANAETGLNGLIERCQKLLAINDEMGSELEQRKADGRTLVSRILELSNECADLRAANADLRKSVATFACNHKGIGLPDCRICDPLAKSGAGK